MYSYNSRIRYSEVDSEKKLDLVSMVNYFQDCSTFQSEDMGLGLEFMEKTNRIWVLNAWQIIIDRLPELGEYITTGTLAYDFRNMYGYRNFIMKDSSSQFLAKANSVWVYMDAIAKRPVRITKEDAAPYVIEDRIDMNYAPRKIELHGNFIAHPHFPVVYSNIDTNQHVNNGQYIKMAEEYLPKGFPIRQIRAEYKMSAVLGDIIFPKTNVSEHICTVVLSDKEDKPYAVIEFADNIIETPVISGR